MHSALAPLHVSLYLASVTFSKIDTIQTLLLNHKCTKKGLMNTRMEGTETSYEYYRC